MVAALLFRKVAQSKMAYSKKVIEHYENPQNVGSMDKNDPTVGTGLVGAPACGDVMKLQLKINDDGIIEDAMPTKKYIPSKIQRSKMDRILIMTNG